jgi:hypothetical protein
MQSILHLSRHQWAVLLEAILGLVRARWQLTRLPSQQLASQRGTLGAASPQEDEAWQALLSREVRWAVQGVAHYLPGRWTCLIMAMAAWYMLARRGLSCTLYLGVRHAEGRVQAHAWLRCGSMYVTGGEGRERFTVIACFGHVPPWSTTRRAEAEVPVTTTV